jgi:hypothetical protein
VALFRQGLELQSPELVDGCDLQYRTAKAAVKNKKTQHFFMSK